MKSSRLSKNSQVDLPQILPSILSSPIPESQYQNLQSIMQPCIQLSKMLNEYMHRAVKNRQYIEAQKAKDKIKQAHACIKMRNQNQVNQKLTESVRKIQAKHEQQILIFEHQWNSRIRITEQKFNEQIQSKRKANREELAKLKQQIEFALPHSYSPDEKLKFLRNQQKCLADKGCFLQAQKIKDQIEARQAAVQQKFNKLREDNIKSMILQLQEKQQRDLKQKQKHIKTVIKDLMREKNKKFKQLNERHAKQIKEIKWIATEQMKAIK